MTPQLPPSEPPVLPPPLDGPAVLKAYRAAAVTLWSQKTPSLNRFADQSETSRRSSELRLRSRRKSSRRHSCWPKACAAETPTECRLPAEREDRDYAPRTN